MLDSIRQQVETNYKAFHEKLPSILTTFQGKFALMRDGRSLNFLTLPEMPMSQGRRFSNKFNFFPFKK
jgi:hypothetical protein